MLCLLLSLITILFAKETKSSNNNWNVEYILEKLLASENFDKVADIIAEKAAKKINELNRKKENFDQNFDREREHYNIDARKDGHEFESNINVAVINDVTSSKGPVKSKLSLKYKLFTKRPIEKSDTEYKNIKFVKKFSKYNSSHYDIEDNIKDINSSSKIIKLNREVVDYDEFNANKKHGKIKLSEKRVGYHKNDDEKGTYDFHNNEIPESMKGNKPIAVEKQVYNLFKKTVNKGSKNEKHESLEENPNDLNKKANGTTVKYVYKEGNRVYALQTSSEYEEYLKEFNRTIMGDETSLETS